MTMAVAWARIEIGVRDMKQAVQCQESNTLIVTRGLSFVFGSRTAARLGVQVSHDRDTSQNAARDISRVEREM